MHRSLSLLAPPSILLSALFPLLHAQSSSLLPGCEVNPDVQNVIDRELDPKVLDRMTFPDRLALEKKTLKGLISHTRESLNPTPNCEICCINMIPMSIQSCATAGSRWEMSIRTTQWRFCWQAQRSME